MNIEEKKSYILEQLNQSLPEDIFVQYAEQESELLSIYFDGDNICFRKHKIELKGSNYLNPKKDRLTNLLEERFILVPEEFYEDMKFFSEKDFNSYLRIELQYLEYDKDYINKEINKLTRECKKAKKQDITFIIDGKEFKGYKEVSDFKFFVINEAVFTVEDLEDIEKWSIEDLYMLAYFNRKF